MNVEWDAEPVIRNMRCKVGPSNNKFGRLDNFNTLCRT